MKNKDLSLSINQHCLCKTLDMDKLIRELSSGMDYEALIKSRPHLFSHTAVYLSPVIFENIKKIIQTIESVISLDSYQARVLKNLPELSSLQTKTRGAFMGYDFHLTSDGPKLIEINTNAGGAYLNLVLARAQTACCEGVHQPFDLSQLDDSFFEMFVQEWRLGGGIGDLTSVAIIDDLPTEQFLYPEFQLFSALFKKHGVNCFILDPTELEFNEGHLFYQGQKIDLIYNRLTDFYFDEPQHFKLKEAFTQGGSVFTPNPLHHAFYANKKNLELLTHKDSLLSFGLNSDDLQTLLQGIPATTTLSEENHDFFWKMRKEYFFKPICGFGSKATYRGDKLTTRVWGEIKKTQYVAQRLASPALRILLHDQVPTELKMDLRAYSYNGQIQLMAGRLYAGQTTNFRTPGGGFAPVFLA